MPAPGDALRRSSGVRLYCISRFVCTSIGLYKHIRSGKIHEKGGEKEMKSYVLYVLTALMVLCFAAVAGAVSAFDYTTVADAVTGEITSGLPLFAGMVGLVIGIPLTVHLAKRLAR